MLIPFTVSIDETLAAGLDTRTPVDDNDYQVPFRVSERLGIWPTVYTSAKDTCKQQYVGSQIVEISAKLVLSNVGR